MLRKCRVCFFTYVVVTKCFVTVDEFEYDVCLGFVEVIT
jgi:hypothetical protein